MMRRVLISLIRGYQYFISPWLGSRCRFFPSCSHYGIEALRRRGVVAGIWLTAHRVLRCHPFHPGGYDPVPESTSLKSPTGLKQP